VTITIGGDDLLALEGTCNPAQLLECVGDYISNTFTTNLKDIYAAIRSTGYEGPIVAVNYFSPDYTNINETQAVSALNSAILSVTELFGGRVADTFSAFKLASGAEGLPCANGVGLAFVSFSLSGSGSPGCDVHPTALGQLVIAQLVRRALKDEDRSKEEFLFSGLSPDTR
jgi:hypothetical protein